jgi:predicted secreted Zn-dependent protease
MGVALALAFTLPQAAAQPIVHWTTNFYSVTGANFREWRVSLRHARPWRDGFDADTRWNVRWNYRANPSPSGCTPTQVTTIVTIVTTLPRWVPPADAAPEVKEQWSRFFVTLAKHEEGHARFGISAAQQIDRELKSVSGAPDCATLRNTINGRAQAILDEHRKREVVYDRDTAHGTRASRGD